MKIKNMLAALAVAVLSIYGTYAQRVEADLVGGCPVINCEGMSPTMYTTTTKGYTESALQTAYVNKTLYKRFAVHWKDNLRTNQSSESFVACSNLGSGWRVPTQRELMLMWVLKTELEKASGFAPFTTNSRAYWSATGRSYPGPSRWSVSFYNGDTKDNDSHSTFTHTLRCIKELP